MYKNNNLQKNSPELSRFYLESAENYLLKSKIEKERETEYVMKAEELIEKARVNEFSRNIGDSLILSKKPTTKFKDVAGLEEVKEKIRLKVIEPLKNSELFKIFGKKFGGGLIMYGPPGCGKSFIAEATAGEADVTYFNVKASDIKGKYVGETEKNMAKLFKQARNNQPCVIFFDEFESLGQERNQAIGHDKTMISQLLTEIDSVGNKNQQIMLIAATNEPWNIDLALRREGRFGNTLFIPPPDYKGRLNILKMQLEGKPLESNFDFAAIAEITKMYSGSDMVEICNTGIENVISDCLKKKSLRNIKTQDLLDVIKKKKELITIKWFEKALNKVYSTNNEYSFKEVIEYANENLMKA